MAIETNDLSKRFGDLVAVDKAGLSVPAGSVFGFVGPNGAGKTTLIRILLGLTRRNGGSARLLDFPIPEKSSLALRRVGAIIEEPRFHAHLTGRENLQVIAAARDPEARARVRPALDRVGLAERADKRVKTYSTGMRQRLGVARCLIADPLLLILDEPMNGLDPAGIEELREMIRGLAGEGRTVFLSSHLLDEVQKICDHVAIIDKGRILMQGPVEDVTWAGYPSVRIRCDLPDKALGLLETNPKVELMRREGDAIIVKVDAESAAVLDAVVADLNRRLVKSGISVYMVKIESISLEKRFLEVTSRLEARE
ncbi:MAG: ATP-binding cassette domain-containing protein [Actinomycetota bacterium]|nr:ATP-binding cassette domain-containing protein [Actinomycetota bacterium]